MVKRTLPGLGLEAYFDLGENDWNDEFDENFRKLSFMADGRVISRTTALPGSGSAGDVYIVATGQANAEQIAIWDGPSGSEAWVYYPASEGWAFYVLDEDINVQFDGAAWNEFAAAGDGGGGSTTSADATVVRTIVPITNGDFETGDLTGWTQTSGSGGVESTGGSNSGVLPGNNGSFLFDGLTNALSVITQTVSITATNDSAVLYQLTADGMKDFTDGDQPSIRLELLSAADVVLARVDDAMSSLAAGNEKLNVICPMIAGATQARITAILDREDGTNNNCAIDNLVLEAITLTAAVEVTANPIAGGGAEVSTEALPVLNGSFQAGDTSDWTVVMGAGSFLVETADGDYTIPVPSIQEPGTDLNYGYVDAGGQEPEVTQVVALPENSLMVSVNYLLATANDDFAYSVIEILDASDVVLDSFVGTKRQQSANFAAVEDIFFFDQPTAAKARIGVKSDREGGSVDAIAFTSFTATVKHVTTIGLPYDQRFGFATTPTSEQVIDTIALPRKVRFSADFAGSVGVIGTNPTSSFVISVQDDGVEIGTITVSTGGVFTFATAGNAVQEMAVGSLLTFVAPTSVDATAADLVVTLAGSI